MSELTCPKCGGSDSFVSQRNIVKGRGIFVNAKMRSVAVCKVCDEIMARPITIETKMPASKMSAAELRKFYLPHLVLLAISLILIVIPSSAGNMIGLSILQVNIVVIIVRVIARKRRSMGIY